MCIVESLGLKRYGYMGLASALPINVQTLSLVILYYVSRIQPVHRVESWFSSYYVYSFLHYSTSCMFATHAHSLGGGGVTKINVWLDQGDIYILLPWWGSMLQWLQSIIGPHQRRGVSVLQQWMGELLWRAVCDWCLLHRWCDCFPLLVWPVVRIIALSQACSQTGD